MTAEERRRALAHDRDRAAIERLGVPGAARIGFRLQRDALAAVRRGARWPEVREIIRQAMEALSPLVLDGMLAAHLKGAVRAASAIDGQAAALSLAGSPHREAIRALQRRARLPIAVLDAIQAEYEVRGLRAVEQAAEAVERQIQEALLQTTEAGAHAREGVQAVREAFAAAGITPQNSFTLENLFRTQTQLAYGAGRWQAAQDEAVQEILWGYKYVTVGDDRVRPEHAALDGVTLPKDDPFWRTSWPPNGFSCRCSAIEIFEPRKVVAPPAVAEIDGREVRPGPDRGFAYNAGEWFGPRSRLPREEAAVPMAGTIQRAEALAREFDLADRVSYRGVSLEAANEVNQAIHRALWEAPAARANMTAVGPVSQWADLAGEAAKQKALDAGKTAIEARAAQYDVQKEAAAKVQQVVEQEGHFLMAALSPRTGGKAVRAGGIVLNEERLGPRKMEALRRSLREAVRTGFHPPGCDTLRSQIDHEIGHHFAGLQRVLSGGTIVDEDLLQYVKASLPDKSVIAREVSRKAICSDRELLAEAWAEYRNSDAPRPVALWIGKFLERKAGIR